MRTLMISLDTKMLDANSAVAERMRGLGEQGQVDIIVPSFNFQEISLSENVKVYGIGGNKIQQFFKVIALGKKLRSNQAYDRITAQDPFLTAVSALLIHKKEAVEIQVHGDFFSSSYFRTMSFKNRLYYWLARLVTLPRAQKIRVVGERVKQSLLKLGYDSNTIEVRPVALDLDYVKKYEPKKDIKKEFPGFRKYFVFVGRLEEEKNVAWLVRVFDQYLRGESSNDVLVIVGSGLQKTVLQKLVKDCGQENHIVFVDWTTQPLDYIKTSDCVLLASKAEGYGLVAMETSATSTALIMTDVGVAHYELQPSEKVQIVPVNNAGDFISALKKV